MVILRNKYVLSLNYNIYHHYSYHSTIIVELYRLTIYCKYYLLK